MAPVDWRKFVGSLSETPLKRPSVTPAAQPPSPGTPGQSTGVPTPLRIIRPQDVAQLKYARRFARLLQLSSASPLDGYISELMGVIPLSQFEIEDRYPDDIVYQGYVVYPQTAANVSILEIFNASGPTVANVLPPTLVVIEEIQVWRDQTPGEITLSLIGTDILAGASVHLGLFQRDLRAPGGSGGASTVVSLRGQQDPTPIVTFNATARGRLLSGAPVAAGPGGPPAVWGKGMVLYPQTGLVLYPEQLGSVGGLVNEGCGLSVSWRQIPVPVV